MAGKKATDLERLYKDFLTAKRAKSTGKITREEFREVSDRYRHAVAVERAAKSGGTVATPEPVKGKAGISEIGG